jgi:hypothetical protein
MASNVILREARHDGDGAELHIQLSDQYEPSCHDAFRVLPGAAFDSHQSGLHCRLSMPFGKMLGGKAVRTGLKPLLTAAGNYRVLLLHMRLMLSTLTP